VVGDGYESTTDDDDFVGAWGSWADNDLPPPPFAQIPLSLARQSRVSAQPIILLTPTPREELVIDTINLRRSIPNLLNEINLWDRNYGQYYQDDNRYIELKKYYNNLEILFGDMNYADDTIERLASTHYGELLEKVKELRKDEHNITELWLLLKKSDPLNSQRAGTRRRAKRKSRRRQSKNKQITRKKCNRRNTRCYKKNKNRSRR